MGIVYDKLMHCYESVRSKIDFVPKVAIILGSGLGDYADKIDVVAELPILALIFVRKFLPIIIGSASG